MSSPLNRWVDMGNFDHTADMSHGQLAFGSNFLHLVSAQQSHLLWSFLSRLVVTKSSTTYNLYTNGSLSLSGSGVDLSLTQYNLGRRGDNLFYVNGRIPQASIYNRALSATEILQNFNATRSRFGV